MRAKFSKIVDLENEAKKKILITRKIVSPYKKITKEEYSARTRKIGNDVYFLFTPAGNFFPARESQRA